MLKKLGVWIGLDFYAANWGKRDVRLFDPVPLHGSDNRDPNESGGDCGCSTGPKAAPEDRVEKPGDGDASKRKSAKEDDSFTKVSRGDIDSVLELHGHLAFPARNRSVSTPSTLLLR